MKVLKKFGVASENFSSAESARGATYTTRDNKFPPTTLACPGNPYITELNSAKYILDFGCGVGRNLPWIMNNTNAHYIGLDPNTDMTRFFWEVQSNEGHNINEWKPRVTLINEFSELDTNIKFDYVVTTFVLQHLGYRYIVINGLNLTEITKKILSRMNDGAVFFAIEHESEEYWIDRWLRECNIKLDTYIRAYKGLPELTERDFTTWGLGHHLMIFKHRTENGV